MKNIKWGIAVPVVALAGAMVGSIALSADASVAPEPRQATAYVKAPAYAVLTEGSIYQAQVNPGVVSFLRTPRAGSVWTTTLNANVVTEDKLSAAVRTKLNKTATAGTNGVSGYEIVGRGTDEKDITVADGRVEVKTLCASNGEVAIGGGANTTGTVTLNASMPSDIRQVSGSTPTDPSGRWAADGWTVVVSGAGHAKPYVICAKMS